MPVVFATGTAYPAGKPQRAPLVVVSSSDPSKPLAQPDVAGEAGFLTAGQAIALADVALESGVTKRLALVGGPGQKTCPDPPEGCTAYSGALLALMDLSDLKSPALVSVLPLQGVLADGTAVTLSSVGDILVDGTTAIVTDGTRAIGGYGGNAVFVSIVDPEQPFVVGAAANVGSRIALSTSGLLLSTDQTFLSGMQTDLGGVHVAAFTKEALAAVNLRDCTGLLSVPTPGLTLSSTYNPWDGSRCENVDALRFRLCQDARVSLTVGGRELRSELLPAGVHEFRLSPVDLDGVPPLSTAPDGNEFSYVIRAEETADPDKTAASEGVIEVEQRCNRAMLPVGRTFVKGVDLFDGHLVRQATDLKVSGRHLGLEVTRSYGSSGQDPEGLLGAGWSFNYEAKLVESSCGLVSVRTADGSSQVFRFDGQDYVPQPGYHTRLVKADDGSFDFYDKAHVRHHFEPGSESERRLLFVEEPHGDRLVLTYDKVRPGPGDRGRGGPPGDKKPARRLKVTYTDTPTAGARSRCPAATRGSRRSRSPSCGWRRNYSYDAFGNLIKRRAPGP